MIYPQHTNYPSSTISGFTFLLCPLFRFWTVTLASRSPLSLQWQTGNPSEDQRSNSPRMQTTKLTSLWWKVRIRTSRVWDSPVCSSLNGYPRLYFSERLSQTVFLWTAIPVSILHAYITPVTWCNAEYKSSPGYHASLCFHVGLSYRWCIGCHFVLYSRRWSRNAEREE